MRRAFVGTGQHMQPAEDYFRAARAIPVGQLVSPARKREMDRDSHDLRHGMKRRTAIEQVFIPVLDSPVRRRGRGKAGQRQSRCEYVLAEAGIRVFGVERINQQCVVRLDSVCGLAGIESRSGCHFRRDPALLDEVQEGFVGCGHACTLQYKVHRLNKCFASCRQSIPFARFGFAISSADSSIGQHAEVEGWFRRGLSPHVERSRVAGENGSKSRSYSRWIQWAISAVVVVAEWLWLTG